MEDTKIWLSRSEAARRLGVSRQTIANLESRGVLHSRKRSHLHLIHRDEVERLSTLPAMSEVREMEKEMERVKEETARQLDALRRSSSDKIRQGKSDVYHAFYDNKAIRRYKRLVRRLAEVASDGALTDMEENILSCVLNGLPLEALDIKYGCGRETIRRHYEIMLRRMVSYGQRCRERADRLESENNRLRLEKSMLEASLYQSSGTCPLELDPQLDEVLRIPIGELGLSVRAYNCLKNLEIEMVGDIISYSKNELMKIRSFGKKSLAEIESALNSMGLRLDD